MKEKFCFLKNKRWLYFTSFNVVSIIISFSAMGFFISRQTNRNPKVMGKQTSNGAAQTCADDFTDVHLTINQTIGRQVHQRYPSCRPTQAQIEELQKKVADVKKRLKETKEHKKKIIPHTPVSVHKYLQSSHQVMNFSNVDHVTVPLDTRSDERNSNNQNRGVKVLNDGIEILHKGLYYVYSSIFYKPNTNVSSENFPYQTWFHYVYRTRPNSPAMSSVILRTVFTCCPNCSNSKDSVYIGGVFQLLAGDVIQVCLSGQGLMGSDTIKDSSFLGLFMLTSR